MFANGYWETDAPLGTDRMREQRQKIQELLVNPTGHGGAIQVRDCEVWVDGVIWRFRHEQTLS